MSKPEAQIKSDWLFLGLVLLIGLALRLDFLFANHFVLDSDEAIVGLMARNILAGRDLPVFYYGQHYMGSLEAICAAGLFAIFGPSAQALKSVPLTFSLILIVLIYAITREVAGRFGARVAALLTAIAPSALIIWSAMARGGFIELVVIGALSFLVLLRWLKAAPFGKSGIGRLFLLGLLIGFGWWVNNQIVYFALPAGFAIFSRIVWEPGKNWISKVWALLGSLLLGAVAFLIGGLPFWIYQLEHEFVSFGMLGRAPLKDMAEHFIGVFVTALPILLGAKRFWQTADVFANSSLVLWLLYGLGAGLYLWFRRREIGQLLILKLDTNKPLEVFSIFIVVCVAVFSISSFGWLVQAPRYLLPIYVGVFVICGAVCEKLFERSRMAGGALVVSLLALHLTSSYLHGRALPGEPVIYAGERVSKDHSELLAWLRANGITWVKTNYWIGYRLAFETSEEVRFLLFGAPCQARIEEWETEGDEQDSTKVPYVLTPLQAGMLRIGLTMTGHIFKEESLSGYQVIYDVSPSVEGLKALDLKAIAEVHSNFHSDAAALGIDRNLHTRWGSAHPQTPGMVFEVDFKVPQEIRGLNYYLGSWAHDFPRGLEIDLEMSDGSPRTLLNAENYSDVRYFYQNSPTFSFYFDRISVRKVILRQLAGDPVFDWSIAELEVLR